MTDVLPYLGAYLCGAATGAAALTTALAYKALTRAQEAPRER